MKKIILLLATFLMSTIVFSQVQKTIVLIPFDSKMFNNQESDRMSEESSMTYEQSVQYFKSSLDEHITRALKDTCTLYSLLRTYTTDDNSDVDVIHQQANYVMSERPTSVNKKKGLEAFGEKHKDKKAAPIENVSRGDVVSIREDNANKFVSANFPDPQLFIDLVQTYSANVIVFITQFEIVGDYSDPYLVGLGKFPRIIKVHYVIFDELGRFLKGNYVSTSYVEPIYNIPELCKIHFPEIAKKIARKIP